MYRTMRVCVSVYERIQSRNDVQTEAEVESQNQSTVHFGLAMPSIANIIRCSHFSNQIYFQYIRFPPRSLAPSRLNREMICHR